MRRRGFDHVRIIAVHWWICRRSGPCVGGGRNELPCQAAEFRGGVEGASLRRGGDQSRTAIAPQCLTKRTSTTAREAGQRGSIARHDRGPPSGLDRGDRRAEKT